MISGQTLTLRPDHQVFVDRFTKARLEDDRIVAAFLGGSYAKGKQIDSQMSMCVSSQKW